MTYAEQGGATDAAQDQDQAAATDPVAAPEEKRRRRPGRPKGSPAGSGRTARQGRPAAKDKRTEAYWRKKLLGDTAPDVPDLADVPASLRGAGGKDAGPKRVRVAAGQEARELREQMGSLLAVVNTGFLAVTPCTCGPDTEIPEALRNAVHLETCARMWALDDDELTKLADALAGELEANPGLGTAVMDRFATWAPHIALAVVIFGIASSRLNRKPNLVVVRQLSQDETAILSVWAASRNAPAEARPVNGARPFPQPEEAPPAAMPE